MIHPNTALRFISQEIGYGVFATERIPEGTIVYVKDSLEHVITPTAFQMQSQPMQEVIEKYSYIDEAGNRIVSWDFAKYVNHCCNCNTMSTGYGFEIAIRDIEAGEQITDEYGIFNLSEEMPLVCGEHGCRKRLAPEDFEHLYPRWDEQIRKSIAKLFGVDQPLFPFVDEETRSALEKLSRDPAQYRSVYALRYFREGVAHA